MKLTDFDYNLPKGLIAQHPLSSRDASKLLVLHRNNGIIKHHTFKDLPQFLNRGDVLVINDTKVFKGRLFGKREGLDGKVEVLLTERREENLYAGLCRPSRKLKEGTRIIFGNGRLEAEVTKQNGDFKLIRFKTKDNLYKILEEIGRVPLPPYIKRESDREDELRYQTVYAKNIGAIAAPTAGLHFTEELIDELRGRGVDIVSVTLHVGHATFKPVKEEDITKHKMHKEYYQIPKETADKINAAKKNGGRVIAVGTTTCRALESAVMQHAICNMLQATQAETDIFIYPGFKFKIADALLTNFHLPRTSLLMLVSAFAGRNNILHAYCEAIERRYRFYSYGDAMLIL